jgi:hypothetical protein
VTVGEPPQPSKQEPPQSPRLWILLAVILLVLTIAALIDRP